MVVFKQAFVIHGNKNVNYSFQFLFFSLFKMNKGKVIAELQHRNNLFSLKI